MIIAPTPQLSLTAYATITGTARVKTYGPLTGRWKLVYEVNKTYNTCTMYLEVIEHKTVHTKRSLLNRIRKNFFNSYEKSIEQTVAWVSENDITTTQVYLFDNNPNNSDNSDNSDNSEIYTK